MLHEFIPDVGSDALPTITGGDESGEPAAILYDGEVLTAPEGGALGQDERAMVAHPGDGAGPEDAGRRSPTFRPDRITSLEGTLGYYSVFTPTIAPFKRVTALDAITLDGDTPVLSVGDLVTRRVAMEGADTLPPDDRGRDRFWGSVVIDFRTGVRVPLPSVSPESRILSMRAEPDVPVHVERDGADNYFVVIESDQRGPVRLVFLTDAPRTYFSTAVPEVPADSLADEVAALPGDLRQRALVFAGELGLDPGVSLPAALDALVEHFRSFEESEEPPTGDDIFLDLARGKKGVCRHRAYPFTIVAQALGIPTRFVQNEAHAWVEVKMPKVGWMRIDLGGAADALEAHNASDRPVYRPREPDSLPKPEPYLRSYSQLAGDVAGLRDEGPGAAGDMSGGMSSVSDEIGDEALGDGATATATSDADPALIPVQLIVDQHHLDVYRGRTLELSGRATVEGDGAAGLRVEVLLAGPRERLLGVTVTEDNGWFQGSFGVPPDVPVGDYQLTVRTPGDEHLAPATAR